MCHCTVRDLQQRKRVSDVLPWWIVCTPTFDSKQFLVVAVRLPEPSTDNSVIDLLRSIGERRQRATGSSKGRDAQVRDTSKTPALSTSLSDHDGGCGAVGVPKPDGDADDHAGENSQPHGAHARPSLACTKPFITKRDSTEATSMFWRNPPVPAALPRVRRRLFLAHVLIGFSSEPLPRGRNTRLRSTVFQARNPSELARFKTP